MQHVIINDIRKQLAVKNTQVWIAVHGPQGCGKSTLCKNFENELIRDNLRVCNLSLDDFYYPYEQLKDFLDESSHPLYTHRGLAGTHDLDKMYKCFDDLKAGKSTQIPVYNKESYEGFGDVSHHITSEVNYDVVLFEGWMIGYQPLWFVPTYLTKFNDHLYDYQKLRLYFSHMYCIEAESNDHIYMWRKSAESAMSGEEFDAFMMPYMEVYGRYNVVNDVVDNDDMDNDGVDNDGVDNVSYVSKFILNENREIVKTKKR